MVGQYPRCVATAIIEQTFQDKRVSFLPRINIAGHTCEYAQQQYRKQLMAFHDGKNTK